jgi:hypothetical protein
VQKWAAAKPKPAKPKKVKGKLVPVKPKPYPAKPPVPAYCAAQQGAA